MGSRLFIEEVTGFLGVIALHVARVLAGVDFAVFLRRDAVAGRYYNPYTLTLPMLFCVLRLATDLHRLQLTSQVYLSASKYLSSLSIALVLY